jgi:hypothetical protein
MKYLFTGLLLFLWAFAYSQPAKDSLLAQDHVAVEQQVKLMSYLERVTMRYYTEMTKDQQAKSDENFYRYYLDTIVKNSPVSFTTIPQFLGYTGNEAPMKWKQFVDRVAVKNLDALIAITKKYGYLSGKRLKDYNMPYHFSSLTFVLREDGRDKELKKLFKQEVKAGNMSDEEYQFFIFILKRKNEITPTDVKWLDKHAKAKMHFEGKHGSR